MQIFKRQHLSIYFIIVTSLISLLAYSLILGASNLLQWYSAHMGIMNRYAHENLISICFIILVLSVNLLDRFQDPRYQVYLMLALIITLVFSHATLTNYFIVFGTARMINVLSQAWIQLYVPPKIRATSACVILSLMGLIDLRSIALQSFWAQDVARGEDIRFAIIFCFIFFWLCARQLYKTHPLVKQNPLNQTTETHSFSTIKKIAQTITENPAIYIAFFLAGLNTSLIYFAYSLGKIALPHHHPQYYEYAIYTGAIALPFFSGRIADKFGIRLILLIVFSLGTACIFIDGLIAYLHPKNPFYLYFITFLESGLGSCSYGLACSLVGSRIQPINLFRAFTIAILFNYLGSYLYAMIFAWYDHSYVAIKLFKGGINVIGTLLFIYYYFHMRKVESVVETK